MSATLAISHPRLGHVRTWRSEPVSRTVTLSAIIAPVWNEPTFGEHARLSEYRADCRRACETIQQVVDSGAFDDIRKSFPRKDAAEFRTMSRIDLAVWRSRLQAWLWTLPTGTIDRLANTQVSQ